MRVRERERVVLCACAVCCASVSVSVCADVVLVVVVVAAAVVCVGRAGGKGAEMGGVGPPFSDQFLAVKLGHRHQFLAIGVVLEAVLVVFDVGLIGLHADPLV